MARKRRSLDTPNDEPIQLSATHNSLGKRGRSIEDEDDTALIQKKRKVADEHRQKGLRGSSSDGASGAGTLRRSLRKRGRTVDEEAGQALMGEIRVDETLLVTGESGQAAFPNPNSPSKRSLDPAEKDHEDSITKKQKVATPECTDEGWEEASSPATLLPPPSVFGLGSSFPEPSSSLETQPQPESESGDVESIAALSPVPTVEAPSLSRDIFPFMNLPAELRLHIYRAALHRDEPLLLHADRPELNEEKAGVAEGYRRSDIYATLRRRRSQQQDSQELSPPTQQASQQNSQQAYQQQRQSDLAEYGIAIPDPERDLIVPALLRLNSGIYKECQPVLYSENTFILSLGSGIHTLSTLHQRSRSLIKSVSLTIPSHHDILDGFADLVRLGLRYCWGLKKFTIILQASLPDDRMLSGATSVYANAFHILRWLPKGCKVVLEGNVSEIVRRVVAEEGRLQETLDDTSYLKRQHQMPERH